MNRSSVPPTTARSKRDIQPAETPLPGNGRLKSTEPCLLQADYEGFNLFGFRDAVYALAVSLGPVDLTRVTEKQLNTWQRQGLCLISSNLPPAGVSQPAPQNAQSGLPAEAAPGLDASSRAAASSRETSSSIDRPGVEKKFRRPSSRPDETAPEETLDIASQTARVKRSLLGAIGQAIDDEPSARNWTFLIDGFENSDLLALAEALTETAPPPREVLEMLIVGLQKERIRRRLDPSKKTVAVYFPTSAYREQFGTIPQRLRDQGCNVITIVGLVCGDKYEQQADVFYGGRCGRTEIVNRLDFVDLFLTPVLVSGLPVTSRKVYFLHDIHDSPLGDEEAARDIANALREFDYIFTPSQASMDVFRQVVALAREPVARPLGLIPGGYPKLDRLSAYFQAHRQETQTLIYAPTVFGYGFDEAASVLHHGEAIIAGVLEGVPDYRLIFRPHPHTLHSDVVRQLAAKFKSHPRFVFDDNASFYMDNYSQAALMISDISGTAFTYAFATERPVVFFSPNEAAVRRQFTHLQYLNDRERIGSVAQTVPELVEQIRLILQKATEFQAAVSACRQRNIFNVDRSEAYFAEHLELILSGQPHPDWTYVRRDGPISSPTVLGISEGA